MMGCYIIDDKIWPCVCVCVNSGECVYICDTLSQQMYVISFRGWSGEGTPERGNKMNEQMKESFGI